MSQVLGRGNFSRICEMPG
ncbi:hypothetical protein LIER_34359 [Lithospermum erythrorhizon]|uniref:Uncharacterized protein n=1 Tax=Lithospermum erythrorhizon TaxID=34254 RepID=A0AAV3RZ95_LITER